MSADKRALRRARESITEAEWTEFQNKTKDLSLDELRALRDREEDPQMRAYYELHIGHFEKLEEIRRLDAEESEKRAARLKAKALAIGPPLWKRVWWRVAHGLNAVSAGLKRVLLDPPRAPLRWIGDESLVLLVLSCVIGFLGSLCIFAFHYVMTLNVLFSGILMLFALYIYFVETAIAEDPISKQVPQIGLILAIPLLVAMFSWKCIGPISRYVGVVTDKAGTAVNILDGNKWFVDTPRWWRGEKIVWYYLPPGSLYKTWRQSLDFGGNDGQLMLKAMKVVDSAGFRTLYERDWTVESREQDLTAKVTAIVERHSGSGSIDLHAMLEEIRAVKNEIFSLRDVTGEIVITEAKPAAPGGK